MTDFTHEWIAKREQLEQAATEGPWVNDGGGEISQHYSCPEPWATIVGTDVACMSYCYGGSGVGAEREEDAEFIADARTSLPAALAALKAVLNVHSPVPALDVAKRYGQQLTQVCTGCGTDDGNFQRWPCPTVRAVEAALRSKP